MSGRRQENRHPVNSQDNAAAMENNSEPDSLEKRLRFGCGFVFGGLVAFLVGLREWAAFTGTFWPFVAGVAVVSGFFAVRYGDAFWRGVSDWFRWW